MRELTDLEYGLGIFLPFIAAVVIAAVIYQKFGALPEPEEKKNQV